MCLLCDTGHMGFLERFDPDFTPNTTDLSGRRYSYRNQTMIGHWNIAQLANAFIAGGIVDQVTCPLPNACVVLQASSMSHVAP